MNDQPIFDIGPIVEANEPDIGVPGTASDVARSRDLQPVRHRSQAQRDRRSGLILAVLAILAALAALVAVPFFTGDDSTAAQEVADANDNGESAAQNAAGDADAGGSSSTGATVPGFEPPSVQHLRADEIALFFSEQIDSAATQYGIAYVANDDFVVLDHRGITVPELEIAVDFDTVSNLALLTNDGRTWAIDTSDRDRSYLVSNSYVVVVSERPGTIAVIRPEDQTQIGLMSSALPVPSVPLPDGAELLWVQGRGPLVMPRAGGTFEVSGLASSLERISDDRAVAASAHGTVYESCDDSLSCRFASQIDDGPVIELPIEGDASFDISPDGAWVVASAEAATVVIDVDDGTTLTTLVPGETAIDWAPDSSFVAVVDQDELTIFYPETQETLLIGLNQVPDDSSLLVFSN